MELIQYLVSGFAVGGVYALVALGFVLIYKATGIINFATGEFMMIGAYVFYTFMVAAGLPAVPAFAVVVVFAALLGFLVERLILRHMLGQPVISIVMVTIGLGSVLIGLAELVWSAEFKTIPPIFSRAPVALGGIIVPSTIFYGSLLSFSAVAVFALIFRYAKAGIAMRATANDQAAAYSMGINVRAMFTLAWGLGAVAAAAGGVIVGNIGEVHPHLGDIGLKIFPVVILGGLDSIGGAVLGGIIIGLIETLAGGYLGSSVKDLAPFLVLVLVLMIKPYGLFGKAEIERL